MTRIEQETQMATHTHAGKCPTYEEAQRAAENRARRQRIESFVLSLGIVAGLFAVLAIVGAMAGRAHGADSEIGTATGSPLSDTLAGLLVIVVPLLIAVLKAWLKSKGVATAMAAGIDSAEARIEVGIAARIGPKLQQQLAAAGIDLPSIARAASKAVKKSVEIVALEAGVEPAVNAVVKSEAVALEVEHATQHERPAVDEHGKPLLPKLALLFALCLLPAFGTSGCVKAAVHESALALQKDVATFIAATEPNHRYTTPGDPAYDPAAAAKVANLGEAIKAHVAEIEEATR